ncbi:MAG: hypothetical protein RJA39_566, partial [Pseudomonadota bacterium]
ALRCACDFLKAEQGAVRQIHVVIVENFFGHAITATEIASVRDADSQIAQGPFSLISNNVPRLPSMLFQDLWNWQISEGLTDDGNDALRHNEPPPPNGCESS